MPHREPCRREEEEELVKRIETPVHSAVLNLQNWLPQRWNIDSLPFCCWLPAHLLPHIATLNSSHTTAAPSATIASADDAKDDEEEEEDNINSPGSQNPDMYAGSQGVSGHRKGVTFKLETFSNVSHCFLSFSISSHAASESKGEPG